MLFLKQADPGRLLRVALFLEFPTRSSPLVFVLEVPLAREALLLNKNRRYHLKFQKCLAKFEIRSQIPLHSVESCSRAVPSGLRFRSSSFTLSDAFNSRSALTTFNVHH